MPGDRTYRPRRHLTLPLNGGTKDLDADNEGGNNETDTRLIPNAGHYEQEERDPNTKAMEPQRCNLRSKLKMIQAKMVRELGRPVRKEDLSVEHLRMLREYRRPQIHGRHRDLQNATTPQSNATHLETNCSGTPVTERMECRHPENELPRDDTLTRANATNLEINSSDMALAGVTDNRPTDDDWENVFQHSQANDGAHNHTYSPDGRQSAEEEDVFGFGRGLDYVE